MKLNLSSRQLELQSETVDEAYSGGMFSPYITLDEFEEKLAKSNPSLKIIRNNNMAAIFDNNDFVCTVGFLPVVPLYNNVRYKTRHIMADSAVKILKRLKGKGYETDI